MPMTVHTVTLYLMCMMFLMDENDELNLYMSASVSSTMLLVFLLCLLDIRVVVCI